MTTITHETRHPALIDRLLAAMRETLARIAVPAPEERDDDIDWEDGEPEDERRDT